MKAAISLLFIALLFPTVAFANIDITFTWDANTESELAGYKLYRSTVSGEYSDPIAVIPLSDLPDPDNPVFTLSGMPTGDYYWALTAYDNEDNESDYSNEVILVSHYYNSIRFDYDENGRLLYKGEHTAHDAAESDTGWIISKYYYDNNDMIISIRIRTTSWTNRTQGW